MGLKAFDRADEVREFPLGRFEIVQIAGVRLGVRVIRPVGSGQFMMLRQWLLVSVARRIPGQFCLDMASSSTRMARALICSRVRSSILPPHRTIAGQRETGLTSPFMS